MKTDTWIGSAVWGRIGGAVMILAAFIAQGIGIDISAEEQQQAFGAIQTMMAAIGGLLVVISKFREKAREKRSDQAPPAANSQSGSANVVAMAIAAALTVCIAATLWLGITGCMPRQTATQQIAAQTTDRQTLVLASYVDAQDAYIKAAETYLPYATVMRETEPDLHARILDMFIEADRLLDTWRRTGTLDPQGKQTFRDLIRTITIEAARAAERSK